MANITERDCLDLAGASRGGGIVSGSRRASASPTRGITNPTAPIAGDPRHELGCVLFEFARADPGRVRALTGAYRQAGGPAQVNRRGHFSMLIAQLGHIAEIAARDWLQPNARSQERADSAAWIAAVLDEPHTRDLPEGILKAAADGGSASLERASGLSWP